MSTHPASWSQQRHLNGQQWGWVQDPIPMAHVSGPPCSIRAHEPYNAIYGRGTHASQLPAPLLFTPPPAEEPEIRRTPGRREETTIPEQQATTPVIPAEAMHKSPRATAGDHGGIGPHLWQIAVKGRKCYSQSLRQFRQQKPKACVILPPTGKQRKASNPVGSLVEVGCFLP